MSRNTKSEIWNYFEYVNADSASCNKCGRFYSRKGRTTTSLKNHLRSAHPQEFLEFLSLDMVRLQKKKKQLYGCNENSFNGTNTTLKSNEFYCRDSISLPLPSTSTTIDIKEEILQPSNIHDIIPEITKTKEKNDRGFYEEENLVSPLKTSILETHHEADSDDNSEAPTATNNNEFLEPTVNNEDEEFLQPIEKKIKVGANDPLNEPTLLTKQTKQRMNNSSSLRVDPLRESCASSPKEDNLERALRRRKLLLEIEQLQIQNYEMKLKLWEKEQQLQMPSSRFTKEIAARKRAAEEENDEYY